jgi:hypothetical protein
MVIHVDGATGLWPLSLLRQLHLPDLTLDVVSIGMTGAPRLWQAGNACGTPSRDLAVGNEREGTAFMTNTIVFPELLADRRMVFASPESLSLQHLVGSTPLKVLAAQVHAFSRAYYGSYRRPENLPATIVLAKSLIANASLREGQRDYGKIIGRSTRLYWL